MKSIIFNQQQVDYALNNKKGMFRLVVKPQPISQINPVYLQEINAWQWATKESRRSPKFQVGETIFVKESFDYREHLSMGNYHHYTAWKKRPAQYMRQEQSRLTLKITGVKVERLQDISEEDCIKEGIGCTGGWNGEDYDDGEFYFGKLTENEDGMSWENEMFEYAEDAFAVYWNETHRKPEEKWEANPWVWVYEYEVLTTN